MQDAEQADLFCHYAHCFDDVIGSSSDDFSVFEDTTPDELDGVIYE